MTSSSASSPNPSRFILAGIGALAIIALLAFLVWKEGGTPFGVSDFALRQKVSADADLHFGFPERMDRASVEQALAKPADIEGVWKWEDNTLVLDPSQPLKAGATYAFTLPSSAATADGKTLGRDLEFLFLVSGPPEVVSRIPSPDSTDVKAESKITLLFDRAVIPLSQVQGAVAEEKLKDWPVTIEPALPGRWRWLSTTAVQFIPSRPLVANTRYTVTVPKGIKTVVGDETQEDFSWSFVTVRPVVTETFPDNGFSLAGPGTPLWVRFNEDVDLASAKEKIALMKMPASVAAGSGATAQDRAAARDPLQQVKRGTPVALGTVTYGKKERPDGTQEQDKSTILLTPAQPLAFETRYALSVQPGVRGTVGPLGSGSGHATFFSTVGKPRVTSARYENGGIHIELNNPVDSGSLLKGITITPAPEKPAEGEEANEIWSAPGWSETRIDGYPALKPRTKYTVTLGPALRDKFGQALEKPFTLNFTTEPLPPEMAIKSKGEFGIFERAKPPVYFLRARNVSRLDVRYAPLSVAEFLRMRVESRNGSITFTGALVNLPGYRSWTVKTANKPDVLESLEFDVAKRLGQSMQPGIYALEASAPEYKHQSPYENFPVIDRKIFALTNMAVTLKFSGERTLVWVTDMTTGEPVPGAKLTFLSLDAKPHLTGVTDKDGFFDSALPLKDFLVPSISQYGGEPEFWVTAEKDGDRAFVSSTWRDGIEPYSFGMSGDFRTTDMQPYRLDSYVYTDRPMYRAGDTVHFKGIARLRDWRGALSLPGKDRKVSVTVTDDAGNQVFKSDLAFTDFGGFSGDFPVDAKAALGYYYLNAQILPEGDIGWNNMGTSFAILAYRKPEYLVKAEAAKTDYVSGETVETDVSGAYYFGAPMSGAKTAWRATLSDYYFSNYDYAHGWYSFSDDEWCGADCGPGSAVIADGEGTLDASGRMTVRVPVSLDDKPRSQMLSIEADVTDLNNQVVSERTEVVVHKSDVYVGIRTDDYVVTPGQEASFPVLTLTPQGEPSGARPVTLRLYSRTWNSIKKKGVDGEYYYDNEPKDTFVKEVSVITNAAGKAMAKLTVPAGGEYRVVAEAQDANKRTSKAATSLYAWSSTYVNWPRANTDRLEIVADKTEYKPGETAKLLVKSPFQGTGVKALVTVEREQVITKRIMDVTSNALPIEVQISKDMLPTAYVSVVIVKPRVGETFDENGLDTGVPAFRIGYARLDIDTSSKNVDVTVQTDKKKYAPGETVKLSLLTKDADGKPVPAEVSVATVDLSLLALSGYGKPELVSMFYSQRGLGLYTAQMLTYLVERYKPGSKGGGGGDGESKTRGDFKDTAYWKPDILTDAQGRATVSFTLPDNLTTWNVLAVAQSKDSLFGSADMQFIETKHVILRPVRPRFAVIGDEASLGAVVHNFLDSAQTFQVTLRGSGFTLLETGPKTVSLKPGEQKKVNFPVRFAAAEEATFDFLATNGTERDRIVEKIPLYAYGVPQSVATSGVTETGSLEKVRVPTLEDAPDGELSLTVSPSLAAYLPKGLEYVAKYPYGCAEQTVSAFLPSIAIKRLQKFKAFTLVDDSTLRDIVTTGFEKLYTYQQPDGGFGYWQDSRESYPYMTAYVLYAQRQASAAGFAVDRVSMDRAASYLDAVLRSQKPADKLDLATRAYILFVLSETQKADIALLNNIYESRAKLPLFAQAQLAMSFKNAGGTGRAEGILAEVLNRAVVDGRGTHFQEDNADDYGWLMNTNQRTTATVLQAMVRIDPDNALLPTTLRAMLAMREDGHWDTTQSTVQSVLALAEYLNATGELDADFTATAKLGDEQLLSWAVTPKDVLERSEAVRTLDELPRGKELPVVIQKQGKGRLYYDLLLSYFYTPGDRIEPAEEGMSIAREMTPLPGQKKEPTVGNVYAVTLTITAPEDREFVAVESPLPAGMEPIDTDFQTAQKDLLAGQENDSWSDDYWDSGIWRFSHKELRDDRVFLFAEHLPAGVYQYRYLVRATTPGKFRLRPAKAWEMYFPEVFGQSEGTWFTVKDAQ